MDSFSTFLYQSGISIAVFYLFYWALLRRETWFTLNRILLFSSLLLAVAIPFVKITLHAAPEPGTVYYALDHYLIDGVIVRPSTLAASAGIHFTVGNALLLLYGAGVLFFLVKFLVQIFQVLHLVHRYGVREFEGYRIVPFDRDISPFSFFTLIFINPEQLEEEELRKVLLHEWEHVRRLHTLDIMLLEIVCIIQWFNPFVWLYKYSLHELHEYEADQAVLSHGENRLSYQHLILSQAFGHNFFPVVHDLINRSFIKKRIIMITKQKSRNITLLKSLLILPVAAILVVSFSFTREPANLQQVKRLLNNGTNNEIPAKKPAPPVKLPVQINVLPNKEVSQQKDTSEGVFFKVEEMPKFQGGDINNFRQWVADHIIYPENAATKGIHGKIYIQFIVEANGNVDNVKVIRGVDSLLNNEAVRVIQSSPKWTPGKQKGHNVPVAYTIPIMFQMDEIQNPYFAGTRTDQEVFFIVEEMPKFQGHDFNYFKKWVAEQLHYPKVASEHGIEGRVFVRFIVFPDGHVDSVMVVRGVDPALDAEAVRVVESSPVWTPGKQRGKKVAVAFTIPITFQLGEKEPPPPVASPGGEVFFIVEQMPKFEGGDINKFREWVASQVKYPEEAAEKGLSGRVLISFIVETDGKVDQVTVKHSSGTPSLDAEAVRVISSSPPWEPGMQRGHKVRVVQTTPIVFVLDHPVPARETLKEMKGKQVVYVLDGKKLAPDGIQKVDAAYIANVRVSTDPDDIKKYGPSADDGVIFISTYKEIPEGQTPPKPKPPKKKK
ncbi:MAG: M56 family metallopeptidase [Bacteroidales bacterium]|nr:M56 family metallopeptidase [Bacteroidales bacterium]